MLAFTQYIRVNVSFLPLTTIISKIKRHSFYQVKEVISGNYQLPLKLLYFRECQKAIIDIQDKVFFLYHLCRNDTKRLNKNSWTFCFKLNFSPSKVKRSNWSTFHIILKSKKTGFFCYVIFLHHQYMWHIRWSHFHIASPIFYTSRSIDWHIS